jgi:nitrogen regulatory protein PII
MRGKAKIQVIEDFNLFDPPITYINEELVKQLIEAIESDIHICDDRIDQAIQAIREQMNE